MTDKFTFSQKVAGDRRRETQFLNMGFDENELKKNGVEQGKTGKIEPKKGPVETGNVMGTFWTACSYCYYKFEYEKKYEECCLRCRNCRKGFHAVAVSAPPENLWNSSMGGKRETRRRETGKRHDIVEISDSDDEKKEIEVKSEGFNNEGRVVMKRVKSVARNSKKVAGRGVKSKKFENGAADGCNEDETELFD